MGSELLTDMLRSVDSVLVQPLVQRSTDFAAALQPVLKPVIEVLETHLDMTVLPALAAFKTHVNEQLNDYEPWEIAALSGGLAMVLMLFLSVVASILAKLSSAASLQSIFAAVRSLPPVRGYLEQEKAKLRKTILESRTQVSQSSLSVLPSQGVSAEALIERMRAQSQAHDVQLADGESKLSGAVYFRSCTQKQLLDQVYALHSYSNPLHIDVFPTVRQMEAEVVAMTASILGGGPETTVCGAMTSGGTESILTAIKASRDYMRATRGNTEPEMIIAQSAHAAYWKAAEYFKIKLHVVPVGADLRLSARTVSRYLNRNTAIIVASAPGFPHGVVDDVEGIAVLARRRRVCVHVDACLGGYLLPFVRELGYHVPRFDFSVAGVTSMSVDTHKYGMSHKGTSVVLYAKPELRQHQYTSITDWSGGLYISPGMAGSRPGALIATAWASLVHLGREGLLASAADIMSARDAFIKGLGQHIPELEVLGEPEMSVVAFRSRHKSLNIYSLNDLLTKRGWHLNALQKPPALHFCFTPANTACVPALLADMRTAVDTLAADPHAAGSGGSAPVYGMSNVSPDRGLIGEFLVAYQDMMLLP